MEIQDFKELDYDFDIVNIGSGPSKYDFKWDYVKDVKCGNFAISPEDFRYDARIIQAYGTHVRKGGIVLIVICPLSFAENKYLKSNSFSYKYVDILPLELVDLPSWKYGLMKNSIIRNSYYFLHRALNALSKINPRVQNVEDYIDPTQSLVDGWLNDNPKLENFRDLPNEEYCSEIFHEKISDLQKVINECKRKSLNPCIVIPPISQNLKSCFSSEFLNAFLYNNLKSISEKVLILDYLNDTDYKNSNQYINGLFLVPEEAAKFTLRVYLDVCNNMDFDFQKISRIYEDRIMDDKMTHVLKNGIRIPWIFIGTGVVRKYTRNPMLFLKFNTKVILSSIKHKNWNRELYGNLFMGKVLKQAYDSGFRGFDTARIYGYSEVELGKVVSNHNDIWINTKCSTLDIERQCSPNTVSGNLQQSLKNIKKGSVNSLLLHWPEGENWIDYYTQIVKEYKKGYCQSFGICNVTIEHLREIENLDLDLPMIVQNEIHPFNVQKEIKNYCEVHDIQLMAHTPTARMNEEIRTSNVLKQISKKHGKSIAQVILRWHYQNKIIPVVSSFNKNHMNTDLDIFDFELSTQEMSMIDSMDKGMYLIKTKGIDDPNYAYNL